MNQDRELTVNWLRVNIPQIGSIVAATIILSMYIQSLTSDVKKIEENRTTSRALLDKDLDNIKRQLDAVANAPLRLDLLEKGLASTNQRMDTYLQTLGNKIDNVSDRVGGLTTKVEVLSQKIEAITPDNGGNRPNPTSYPIGKWSP